MRMLEDGPACWACGRGDFVARVTTSAMMAALKKADNAASMEVTRQNYVKHKQQPADDDDYDWPFPLGGKTRS